MREHGESTFWNRSWYPLPATRSLDFREGGDYPRGKYRFWRENYVTLDIARANVARNVLPAHQPNLSWVETLY